MKEAIGKYAKKRMNRKSIKSKSPMTLVDFKGDNLPEEYKYDRDAQVIEPNKAKKKKRKHKSKER